MRGSMRYGLVLGVGGLTLNAISHALRMVSEGDALLLLDLGGGALLFLCMVLLFISREDYPASHTRALILSMVLLAAGYIFLFAWFYLQGFVLNSIRMFGTPPDMRVLWVGLTLLIASLILIPVVRALPLHALLDRTRQRVSIGALIVSLAVSVLLALLLISEFLNLSRSLALHTPFDPMLASSLIQVSISNAGAMLTLMAVGDAIFASVYLLALVYGVRAHIGIIEDAMLIYNDGRLIHHGTRRIDPHAVDEDILASMLTAVQDFVREGLQGRLSGPLESIRVGEYDVMLVRGRYVSLAITAKGAPLAFLRERLRTILGELEERHAASLRAWEGNVGSLDTCISEFKAMLKIES